MHEVLRSQAMQQEDAKAMSLPHEAADIDPVAVALQNTHFLVRDYIEIGQQIATAHDEQEKAELKRSQLDLITTIADKKNGHLLTQLTDYYAVRDAAEKARMPKGGVIYERGR